MHKHALTYALMHMPVYADTHTWAFQVLQWSAGTGKKGFGGLHVLKGARQAEF